jgi:hypothetical protein
MRAKDGLKRQFVALDPEEPARMLVAPVEDAE